MRPLGSKSKANERDALIDLLYRMRVIGSNAEDPTHALESILEIVQQFFTAHSASIALINPDTRQLEVEVNRGLPKSGKDIQLPLGAGVTGWVALHGKSLRVDDVESEPRYIKFSEEVKSELACPMIEKEHTTGVISIKSDRKAAFTEESQRTLEIIAEETTQIVSQFWLIDMLRQRSEQLEALVSMGQDLVSKFDLDELLETITSETHKIMQCNLAMLLILDPKRNTLKIHSIKGASRKYDAAAELNAKESSFGTAIRFKRTIELVDLRRTEEEHFWEIVQGERLESMICCPILWEGEAVGILAAYSNTIHRVNNEEKRLFNTLASFSGVAIQNLRLYSLMLENEEILRKNDKLITLGLLAAEIAHEIRNPLMVIKLLFDSLDLDFEETDHRKKDAKIIDKKIRHLEGIVEQVLSFGKSSQSVKFHWSLQSLIKESLRLVRLKLIQNKITTQSKLCSDSLVVDANQGQIQQVILNLILNAIQAMPNGGDITFECYREEIDDISCGCIDIKDTGNGIEEHLKEKIFDSFLTGREEGTGLGLSIVKRILRSHQGDILLLETGPKGTRMKLWIPLLS